MNDILRLIDLIYRGAQDQQCWPDVAQAVHEVVGVKSVNLALTHDDLPELLFTCSTGATEADGEFYLKEVFPVDETLGFAAGLVEGDVCDFPPLFNGIPFEELEATKKFYGPKDWYQTKVAKFVERKGKSGWLALLRGKHDPPFSKDDHQLLQTLTPHLAQAYEVQERILSAQRASSMALDTLDSVDAAILLLDESHALVHTNARAEQYLQDGVLRKRGKGVRLPEDAADKQLGQVLEQIRLRSENGIHYRFANVPMAFLTPGGDHYIAYCIPYRGSQKKSPWLDNELMAALFILDGQSSELMPLDVLQASYSLTKTEALVLQLVLNDVSTADIAERLQISKDAIRFHLKNLFRKTGTHRQAELVGLVFKTIGKLSFSEPQTGQ